MREKLIELLYEARMMCEESYCAHCEYDDEGRCMQAMQADHIIANGVTVRQKGEWIRQDDTYTRFMCSNCETKNHAFRYDYCHHCGADMRGEHETD